MRFLIFHEESAFDGFANKFFVAHLIHLFFFLWINIIDCEFFVFAVIAPGSLHV